MRSELITDAPSRERLEQPWEELASAAFAGNVFYEPWMAKAAMHLREAAGLTLLAVWQDDTALAGILPLQAHTALDGRLRLGVQNWEQRVRALGDPLIRAGCERAFWAAALDFLDRSPGIGGFLRLSTLAADSPSTRALMALLEEQGRRGYVTRRFERAQLLAGPDVQAYIAANIRKKVLKEQRRLRNRLADEGPLQFDRLPPDGDARAWADELFRLEMTGWKGRDGVAAAADPDVERAFRDVLCEAHRRGRLDFHRMRIGDKIVSMLANIETGNRAIQLKIAYDEAYASFSPGVLLEMAYLEYALDVRKLDQVDSCARPGHPMIDRIWVDRLPIVSLAIPFDRVSSRLLCAGQDFVRRARHRRSAANMPEPPRLEAAE